METANMTTASFHTPLFLPEHCDPQSQFLVTLSVFFQTCIPTYMSLLSSTFGFLSILSWLFSQIPQIIKNYQNHSVEGLSMLFLTNWLLGDICNFLGAMILNQMFFQKIIGGYYVVVDLCLMGQYLWYGIYLAGRKYVPDSGYIAVDSDGLEGDDGTEGKPIVITGVHPRGFESGESSVVGSYAAGYPSSPSQKKKITGRRSGSSSYTPGMSPNTFLAMAMLCALASASPAPHHSGLPSVDAFTSEEGSTRPWIDIDWIGTVISWVSTILYCSSRLPQLYKNYQRRSTSGLSITLFIAAFFGNLFYSASLLANPLAWADYPPYGGGGLAGEFGSSRRVWWANSLPFFLGASGVLCQDAAVFAQWLYWGGEEEKPNSSTERESLVRRSDRRMGYGSVAGAGGV